MRQKKTNADSEYRFRYNVITRARLRLKANVATDEGKDRNET